MSSRAVVPSLAAALLLALSGCVFNVGNPNPGNVTFRWTFIDSLHGCSSAVGVDHILVQIPGETLDNGGAFPCTTSGVDGIKLLAFAGGDYSYTVTAVDASNRSLYQATGTFIVDGDVTVPVVLAPGGGTPGGLLLSWTFPQGVGATCALAPGPLTTVQVSIDSAAYQAVPCTEGQGTSAAQFINLAPGTHTIDLLAQDATAFAYFRTTGSFTVSPGAYTAQTFGLGWYAGSLPVRWTFSNGSQLTCAQAGVSSVVVNLRLQGTSTWLYGNTGSSVPCTSGGFQGTLFPYLNPGTYELYFQAGTYHTNAGTYPTATVTAGAFPVLDGTSQTVVLSTP